MLKFRWYYDKDAEQDWLNEMCLKGWEFQKFFLGFYTFKKCEPGEYNYQIDLIEGTTGADSDYDSFMEDSGVEVVAHWQRWVYLRKKSTDGEFNLYTDAFSKISQYKRIRNFFATLIFIELCCFFLELNAAIRTESPVFIFFTALIGLFVLVCIRMTWKCKLKIESLEQGLD